MKTPEEILKLERTLLENWRNLNASVSELRGSDWAIYSAMKEYATQQVKEAVAEQLVKMGEMTNLWIGATQQIENLKFWDNKYAETALKDLETIKNLTLSNKEKTLITENIAAERDNLLKDIRINKLKQLKELDELNTICSAERAKIERLKVVGLEYFQQIQTLNEKITELEDGIKHSLESEFADVTRGRLRKLIE